MLYWWPHYKIIDSLKTIADVRTSLSPGADELNWLFLSTSGAHGTYTSLNDIEGDPDPEDESPHEVTVLICHPRLVVLKYGCIDVPDQEDRDWLREQVARTIEAIIKSQAENLPKPVTWPETVERVSSEDTRQQWTVRTFLHKIAQRLAAS